MVLLVLVLVLAAAAFAALWVLRLRLGAETFRDTVSEAVARWGPPRRVPARILFKQVKRALTQVVLTLPSGRLRAPEAVMIRVNPDDFNRLADEYGWDILVADFVLVYRSMARRANIAVADGGPRIYLDPDPSVRRGWIPPAHTWRNNKPHESARQVGPQNFAMTDLVKSSGDAASPEPIDKADAKTRVRRVAGAGVSGGAANVSVESAAGVGDEGPSASTGAAPDEVDPASDSGGSTGDSGGSAGDNGSPADAPDTDAEVNPSEDDNAEAETDADTDTDTGAEADANVDAEAATDTGADAEADAHAEIDAEANADVDAEAEMDAEANADVDAAPDTDTEADTAGDADAEADTDTGAATVAIAASAAPFAFRPVPMPSEDGSTTGPAALVLRGPAGESASLSSGDVLGRDPGVALRFDSTKVSRRHASVTWQEGRWLLEDLGSSNGTYLNGVRLKRNTPTALRQGDRFRLGKTGPRFEVASPPAPGDQLK